MRYLATGDSYHSLMYGFRVAHNTISKVIIQVCEAIIAEYAEEMVPCPTTAEQWKEISKVFSNRWNFHHCLGALDGSKRRGFLILQLQRFSLPDALPNDDKEMPYFIIGDDAFALQKWLMKPFSLRNLTKSQRIYNYRLSRARRIAKNVAAITLTCVTLHNLLRNKSKSNVIIEDQEDDDHQMIPGAWRNDTPLTAGVSGFARNTSSIGAKMQRDYLCAYYNSEAGSVPWQNDMV